MRVKIVMGFCVLALMFKYLANVDVVLGWKQVLLHNNRSGSILAASGEIILPIGDEGGGFGKGVTVIEPFVSFGQVLRGDSFIQAQAGIELPTDTAIAAQEAFWRVAAGKSFARLKVTGPN